MSLITLPSPIYYPGQGQVTGGPSVGTEITLQATTGLYTSYIFSAKEDMTISHVGFKAGTAANSPTVNITIETLDASGLPSGTLWSTNTSATTATISSNAYVLTALTASATVTKGQFFCVKLAWGGVASSTVVIQSIGGIAISSQTAALPYRVTNTGTPAKATMVTTCLALGSNSTTFYQLPFCLPVTSITSASFNNTNSQKRGMRFIIPMNCRAIGMRWYHAAAIGGDFNISLMNDAGTELASSSTAVDGDYMIGAGASLNAYFDNTVTLTAGTAYRIGVEPTTATNASVYLMTMPSSDYFGAMPGGSNTLYASLTSGVWTDSTTQIIAMDVILDQIDNGSGGGGGGGITYVIGG